MKIAIAHNSKDIVEELAKALTGSINHHIIWVARNGADAVKKTALNPPDLLVMGISLPILDCVEATRVIMQKNPCAILLVSSDVNADASLVFEAMGYGAIDVCCIETSLTSRLIPAFLEKINTVARLLGKITDLIVPKKKEIAVSTPVQTRPPLLVIGSSTGGPAALARILSTFPKDSSFSTIVVQHVDEKFADGLAQWLARHTQLTVELAHTGSIPKSGTILLAGQSRHLVMNNQGELKYTSVPLNEIYKPSIDVFFNSIAQHWPSKSVAVLLTGMGNDGAEGLKQLHEEGWYTIVEHQESCVVYGMPKAAIEIGAASIVLPIDKIGPAIISHLIPFP